ncbi:MAG: PfkB family carbohydrate kinase, partial [Planctomycetota bacterium]|nr:PfkB family carbohydrate kinase [Planctomycetota bacterium]
MQRLIELLEGFGSARVALLGDFMLDEYVYGNAERLSPEAPVPVLSIVDRQKRAGGAAGVATAILALGAKVACITVVGADSAGDELVRMMSSAGAETSTIVRLNARSTIVKTRFVGLAQHRHAQQMIRVDHDVPAPLAKKVLASLRAAVRSLIDRCDVLAVEDYNKGVLTDTSLPQIIADARKAGIPVVADPARISDYRRYRGATVLTPNRTEAELASGINITDDESLHRAAGQILHTAAADAVVVTLDREGAYLLKRDGEGSRIPHARPRSVYDITGAGDEVLAMLAVATAEGCQADEAVALANVAGGLEVEQFGVVPIARREVLNELRRTVGLRSGKVMERKPLLAELKFRRARGEKIVFTNGCFDLLHVGHVRYLRQARQLGDCLVVAINSDDSTRRLKGPARPVIGQDERAEMLGALESVDYVTVFREDTPVPLLKLL